MEIEEALKLSELWKQGKMIGGDGRKVRKVLYEYVLKLKAEIERLKEENAELDRIVKIESKTAGDRWKKYDAEVQDHSITKKENEALKRHIKELEAEIKRLRIKNNDTI